jgi:hypothetical protein
MEAGPKVAAIRGAACNPTAAIATAVESGTRKAGTLIPASRVAATEAGTAEAATTAPLPKAGPNPCGFLAYLRIEIGDLNNSPGARESSLYGGSGAKRPSLAYCPANGGEIGPRAILTLF